MDEQKSELRLKAERFYENTYGSGRPIGGYTRHGLTAKEWVAHEYLSMKTHLKLGLGWRVNRAEIEEYVKLIEEKHPELRKPLLAEMKDYVWTTNEAMRRCSAGETEAGSTLHKSSMLLGYRLYEPLKKEPENEFVDHYIGEYMGCSFDYLMDKYIELESEGENENMLKALECLGCPTTKEEREAWGTSGAKSEILLRNSPELRARFERLEAESRNAYSEYIAEKNRAEEAYIAERRAAYHGWGQFGLRPGLEEFLEENSKVSLAKNKMHSCDSRKLKLENDLWNRADKISLEEARTTNLDEEITAAQ